MGEICIKGKNLPFSSELECTKDEKGNFTLFVKDTSSNMQVDATDFESITIWMWSVDRSITVTLKFNSYDGNKDKNEENHNILWSKKELRQLTYMNDKGCEYAEPARLHHMRFLYRVMRFCERYPKGFTVDSSNHDEIEKFKKLYTESLKNGELWITKPTTKGGMKGCDNGQENKSSDEKVAENHLEKYFVVKSAKGQLPEEIVEVFGNNRLYDQLPCCMFIGEPESTTRIFNAGYFDLWGINDNKELCIFELKKDGNNKLGIISELFFYAMLMRDMKRAAEGKYTRIRANHRGFKDFVSNTNSDIVNAYFLVPELHSSLQGLKDAFIKVLNENNEGVKFGLIQFSQEEVENDIVFKNLKSEWKKIKD